MNHRLRDSLVQDLCKFAALPTGRDVSDQALLDRFLQVRDEFAFTVLVERHGPMVLGVCRRALRDRHDAEDACQATFLVLARKATSIRRKRSIGGWLHGVARRVAASLRRQRSRRERHELQAAAPGQVSDERGGQEVRAWLDEELERLPERYRAPLVLCYLGGVARDEAARQLGLTAGGLHGRLERGRHLLRERLTQRGIPLAAALLASALGEGALRAAPLPTVVLSTARAAGLIAAGLTVPTGVVPAPILSLAQGALRSMFVTKLKTAAALVFCAGLLAGPVGTAFIPSGIAQEAKGAKADVPVKEEGDEAFIRRTSKDLRGSDPTPAEVHFFLASPDAGKRQKLIDLFIQERQAKRPRATDPNEKAEIPEDARRLARARRMAQEAAVEFHLQDAPWDKVFELLAAQSQMPVTVRDKPVGTFTYVPPRGKQYTLVEVIDILNEGLGLQDRRLIRSGDKFLVVGATRKIDPADLDMLPGPESLALYGKTEYVSLVLQLKATPFPDAVEELGMLKGPSGVVVPLPKTNRVILHDTAGNAARISKFVEVMNAKVR